MDSQGSLVGSMIEIHLLNGKRFLGKVLGQERDGLIMSCVPLKALETMPPSSETRNELREMRQTLFFPWVGVEYLDVGGHPVGFESLYSPWFGRAGIESFFSGEES